MRLGFTFWVPGICLAILHSKRTVEKSMSLYSLKT